MERLGFIHEKLDIKLLILFVLRRLPSAVSFEELSELVLIDDGIDYFDYTQCLAELVETEHIEKGEQGYKITKKGIDHSDTVESRIPFSVRSKAEVDIVPIIERMKRDALIKTSHKTLDNGGNMVKLSLSDGIGNILSLSILTAGEEQSTAMEKYFRADAEGMYHKIIALLTPPPQ
ncbi:MAG: DUF4364 family protein [Oscillospiraceae bacterium]